MIYVPRKLWYQKPGDDDRTIVAEDELPGRSKAIVVLAEPGMGKTALLARLAKVGGTVSCTARKLINTHDPAKLVGNATKLVIDALDEVAANLEGAAVDRVVQKLDAVGNPPFILSCRVADWQAATSAQTIKEMYGEDPLIVHLLPLERDDQIAILADEVGVARSEELLAHFEAFDLDLLGNPQTLLMIARLSAEEALPTTKGDLFEKAVDRLWCEHREGRGATELDRETALDAAGAAFATLILTGSSAIVRHGAAHVGEGELAFAEVDRLAGGNLARILGSRLFEGGQDSFTYWHRRIGEFLGARWLAKRADTPVKRRRLLHLFQSRGLVPASLRGLHAWLARDPKLARAVIATDPMGIVEYGDADALTPEQARQLFDALRRHASENPDFWRWEGFRARALVSTALHDEIEAVLRDRSTPFDLRALIAEQFVDATPTARHRDTLRERLLDRDEVFAIRHLAAQALTTLTDEDWPTLLEELRQQGTESSTRLAFEWIQRNGFDGLSDVRVVETLLAYDGLTLAAVPEEEGRRGTARYLRFAEKVPTERLDGLIETLTAYTELLLPEHPDLEAYDLIGCAHDLIRRRLELGPVEALRLWAWLTPYRNGRSYLPDHEKAITEWIRDHDDVRRAIQRHVLLNEPNEGRWLNLSRLTRASPGLDLSESDVVALLGTLDPTNAADLRWRELLQLIPNDENRGRAARAAAAPFAAHDPALEAWLVALAVPKVPEWKAESDAHEVKRREELEARFADQRKEFLEGIDRLRAGEHRFVRGPALAYLKLLHDIGQKCPAHERVAEWLGEELAEAARQGFEAHLMKPLSRSDLRRLAVHFGCERRWRGGRRLENTSYIVVAGLAERVRLRDDPFSDLDDRVLSLGLFAVWSYSLEVFAELPGLGARIEAELRRRGVLEQAIRLFFGAQFKQHRTHVSHLYGLMRSEVDGSLVNELALMWLRECADLHHESEEELIDRALRSTHRLDFIEIGTARRALALTDERRRNWDAVQVIVDFAAARDRLLGTVDPDLLWHLRDRSGGDRHSDRAPIELTAEQLQWIIETFRGLWPVVGHPLSGYGDTNPWDATDYLNGLIARLGEDTSDKATRALEALRDTPTDGYTDRIKAVLAEQRAKRVEQIYVPPKVAEIGAIVDAGPPTTASDLQAVMLETLAIAQKQLKGDDVDWYRGFYREDGRHKDEEPCRDELIKMLRAIDGTLEYIPELHVADDKRVDIVARVDRQPILPIEIKGTWHDKLWTAADDQLNHQYVEDWRAERGIYLVLWFGGGTPITKPPTGIATPTAPEDLRRALVATSRAARDGLVAVVVLDLTRPTAS
ncbi:MAG: hypothetical protein LWW93_07095 [Hyphomicrobiales bacterium]|nr:hypothetical protein [Hyphomicrobiales bacterium]